MCATVKLNSADWLPLTNRVKTVCLMLRHDVLRTAYMLYLCAVTRGQCEKYVEQVVSGLLLDFVACFGPVV